MKLASMNRNVLTWLAVASLSSMPLASSSWAQGPDFGPEPGRMLQHMSRSLELTETQQSNIGQIMDVARDQSAADRKRIKELRDQLRDQQAGFDPGKAQSIADELGQVTTRLAYQGAATHAQVYEQLDAEQRQKMAEFQDKRGEHKGRHHDHDRRERADKQD